MDDLRAAILNTLGDDHACLHHNGPNTGPCRTCKRRTDKLVAALAADTGTHREALANDFEYTSADVTARIPDTFRRRGVRRRAREDETRAEAWESGVRQAIEWLRADYEYGTGPDWREVGAEWIADRLAEHTRAAIDGDGEVADRG